jgi:hypothetical protein
VISGLEVQVTESGSFLSSPTLVMSSSTTSGDKRVTHQLYDANGNLHCLVKYNVTKDPSGRQRMKMQKYKLCAANNKHRDIAQYCFYCGESFSLCNACGERDCFHEHISSIKRITRHTKKNAD